MKCARCEDVGWVCEAHDFKPWGSSPNARRCGEPGMPCPDCNASDFPRLPPGFKFDIRRTDDCPRPGERAREARLRALALASPALPPSGQSSAGRSAQNVVHDQRRGDCDDRLGRRCNQLSCPVEYGGVTCHRSKQKPSVHFHRMAPAPFAFNRREPL
jgi:hypothetical protein